MNKIYISAMILYLIVFCLDFTLMDHGHSHSHKHPHKSHHQLDYSYLDESGDYIPPEPDTGGRRWWKGNLHTHTLWSDGDQFPEVVVDWYKKHHYEGSELNVARPGRGWITWYAAGT